MEELALERETDDASKDRLERLRADLADREEELRGLESRWEREKAALEGSGELRKQIDELRVEAEPAAAHGDLRRRLARSSTAASPLLEKQIEAAEQVEETDDRADGQRGGRAQRDRRGGRGLDRHPDRPAARGRDRQAAADGGHHRRAAGRPAGRGRGRLRRRTTQPGRDLRPQPPDRLLPVPRPDRRRQDRAGQVAGRLPLRRRARDRAHRHERVLREALGLPAGRRPSRLRRLRRGRPAHRGRAASALQRGAARRGREGAPGGLRHPAAGARRRPADRRPGPHRRLPQHAADPDQQPGLGLPRRPDPGRGEEARVGDGRRASSRSSRSSSTGSTRS